MRCCKLLVILALAIVAGHGLRVSAELKLPTIISDHMVLQRGQEVPIWGWDAPGTEVIVSLGEQNGTGRAGDDGKFTVRLPKMKAGGPYKLKISGTTETEIKDVLVGEVWFCSGQSNMEWTVSRSNDAAKEIARANSPKIRHIKFPHVTAAKPATDVKTVNGWESADPKTVGNFTAVGYYFALHLQEKLGGIPVGIIGCNWGGTRVEPWTPPVGFKSVPELKDIADKLDTLPAKRGNGTIDHRSPLSIYNGMVAPLVPYGVRGFLWYQGESNNGEGMLYFHKKKALITGWRKLWKNDDLPFYFVQLAPYVYGKRDPTHLAGIWEAQTATLQIPHTGMAVTVDIGNTKNIHPKNKQDVGKRLALWALAKNYGHETLVYSGPLFSKMKAEGGKIRLSFEHVAGGLKSRDGKPLSWFTIAGKDKKFVKAEARIDGNTVVVSADSVKEPVAVRFGWDQAAEPNLSNDAGLPASPFRTDKW